MRYATTEEARTRSKDFPPYRVKEVVTGLGVKEPPPQTPSRRVNSMSSFQSSRGGKCFFI